MWKIHDEKVKVYQAPDFSATLIAELKAGDRIGKIKGVKGSSLILIELPDGKKGYIDERVKLVNIGNGTRHCPRFGHLNSVDSVICSECKLNFHPVVFRIPEVDMKKSNSGHWDGQGAISIPQVCSSCCSATNLRSIPIVSEYSTTTSNLTVSTKITSKVGFNAYICAECIEIIGALEKYSRSNTRFGVIYGLYLFSYLSSAVIFVVGLLSLIDWFSHGHSILLPISLLLVSTLLFIGTKTVSKQTDDRRERQRPSNVAEYLKLIELYGHTYQPIFIENLVETPGWNLKIYNQDYAGIIESLNGSFVKVEN